MIKIKIEIEKIEIFDILFLKKYLLKIKTLSNNMKINEEVLVQKVRLSIKDTSDIDSKILNQLIDQIQGTCRDSGYIRQIKRITERSSGLVDVNSFKETIYNVWFLAEVVQIQINDIIYNCNISLITKAGIFAKKENFIDIFINADYLDNDFENKYHVNQQINVIVYALNCTITRPKIEVIGNIFYYHVFKPLDLKVDIIPSIYNDYYKIKLNTEDKKKNIKNEGILGYTEKLHNIKKRISNIDNGLWDYYKKLLNPIELNIKNNIPSRAYYKLWEILNTFNPEIIHSEKVNILNLCEAPGGFIKCLLDYRKKFTKDTYLAISCDKIPFHKSLNNQKNITLKTADIIDPKIIKMINNFSADIITADGGISTKDLNFDQEREMLALVYSECVSALISQKIDGLFIIKVFDTYTEVMCEILYLLYLHYNTVHIYKPQSSRSASSEKYFVFSGFRGINKKLLTELIGLIPKIKENKYFSSILNFTNKKEGDQYDVFIEILRVYNNQISKIQFNKIIEITEIIKQNNFEKMNNNILKIYHEKQKKIIDKWLEKNNLTSS